MKITKVSKTCNITNPNPILIHTVVDLLMASNSEDCTQNIEFDSDTIKCD